jgi:Fe2+ transport system protein FeoA
MTSSNDTITLWDIAPSASCLVSGFDAHLPEPYRVRLMEFGFHPGELVECLLAPQFGAPRVYRVSDTVYSLDRDIATLVHVSPAAGVSS